MRPNFEMERPGVYTHYEDYGTPIEASAVDAICAAVIQANTGKSNEVVTLESVKDIAQYEVENGSGVDTTEMLYEMFRGGARKIYAVRLDDTPNAAAYQEAFELLKPFRWNVIGIDTDDAVMQGKLHDYVKEMHEEGNFVMGVVGAPASLSLASHLTRTASFDDSKIIYVGSGFVAPGSLDRIEKEYEGYLAAARVAGMIAGTPSSESVTHKTITGAVKLTKMLKNSEQIDATKGGMLTFSLSPSGTCWIECGVNTLQEGSAGNDPGWQKIKRAKIRFELMQRVNDTVENLIGRINNDPDGRATIIQAAQGVCNSMVNERKLLDGAEVMLDEDNPPVGESAYFLVYADDIDSVEKMWFTFKFRFDPTKDSSADNSKDTSADDSQD